MIIRRLHSGGGSIVKALQARQAESDRRRPKGLHVSQIVNYIVEQLHPAQQYSVIEPTTMQTMYEIGDIIEDVISAELVARSGWVKPTPRVIDGIILSPDGWSPRSSTVDEMKSTRISCNSIVQRPSGIIDGIDTHPKLLKYVLQLKSYMYGWEAKRGRLHAIFLNGNYREKRFPIPEVFVLRPEGRHELREHWEMVTDTASDMKREGLV